MRKSLQFVLAALLFVSTAHAAPTAEAVDRAGKLRDQGNEAMLGMRYSDALALYKQALDLTPDALGLLYSIARADQFLGDYPQALAALERFAKEAPPDTKAKVGRLDGLFAELRPRVATLDLKCSVAGARVIVRDKVIGTTPLPPTRLPSGAASLQVEMDGFFTQSRDVVLPGNGQLALQVELHPKSTFGLVAIHTLPIGANVSVDGKDVGTSSPTIELALPPGPHDVIAEREGYDRAKVPVVLVPGATREITLTMDRTIPITSRWWFWTGVAVVVTGGVVLTYALVTEKSADKGTLSPGQVSAPLMKF